MQLTNAHRRALKYYQRLHGTRPTMLSLLALVWWRYLLVVIAAAIAVLILPSALNFLLAGFVLGMVFRDLQRFRHWARLWQMYEQILAWDEIEALLAPNGRPMAALLVTQPSAARSHGWRAAPTSPRPGD
jgi:hypothetical protein